MSFRYSAALISLAVASAAVALPPAAIPSSRFSFETRQQQLDDALIAAVQAGDLDRASRLLGDGADANARERRPLGEPALLKALIAGRADLVSILVSHGADANARDSRGTPILVAAASLVTGADPRSAARVRAIHVLLDQGKADPNAADTAALGDARGALHMACANGSLPLAQLLLGYGADPNRANRVGETPIFFAAEGGHLEVARLLVAHGADPNPTTRYTRMNPLMTAAENGRAEVMLYLLSLRVDPSSRNAFGETPLVLAKAARNRVPASLPEWRGQIDRAVAALTNRNSR